MIIKNKILKLLIVVMLAVIMTISVFAFTACDNDNNGNGGNGGGNNNITTPNGDTPTPPNNGYSVTPDNDYSVTPDNGYSPTPDNGNGSYSPTSTPTPTPIPPDSLLDGIYRLYVDGVPQIVIDAATVAGNTAALPAPAAATAIRAIWDAMPNTPIIPVMTQLRTWWAGASLVVNPLLPGDITVDSLGFDASIPNTEDEFFAQLEQAIFDRLFYQAHDAVMALWSTPNVYIVIYEGTIELEGFGLVLGTDRFSGTFTVIDNTIQPEWIDLVPPLAVGAITFTGYQIQIVITDNLTLLFYRYDSN